MSRIRANKITNKLGTGAVELEKGAHLPIGMGITGAGGLNITGVVTATSFSGSGAALTGIDATSVKDSGGNVKIQAQASGAVYTGIHTFTTLNSSTGTFSGAIDANGDLDVDGHTNLDNLSVAGVATVAGNLNVGGVLTYEDVTNVDSVGMVTARAGLKVTGGTSFFAGAITAAGAIAGTASTATTIDTTATSTDATMYMTFVDTQTTGRTLRTDAGVTYNPNSNSLTAGSFVGDGSGLTGLNVGLTTEALTTAGSTVTLDLTKDDHKITKSGTYTITCTGGTESESHTLRIVNSGTATVSFSDYFLFPSGGTPSLPTTNGAISLISFTVHRAGAVGINTQLLAGSSVNFS